MIYLLNSKNQFVSLNILAEHKSEIPISVEVPNLSKDKEV